jgi:hypothetical protein
MELGKARKGQAGLEVEVVHILCCHVLEHVPLHQSRQCKVRKGGLNVCKWRAGRKRLTSLLCGPNALEM